MSRATFFLWCVGLAFCAAIAGQVAALPAVRQGMATSAHRPEMMSAHADAETAPMLMGGAASPEMAAAFAAPAAPMPMRGFANKRMDGGGSAGFGAATRMSGVVSDMLAVGVQTDSAALQGPVVLRSASMVVEAKDVAGALNRMAAAVEAAGGFIESSSSNTDEWLLGRWREAGWPEAAGPTNGHLNARVPAAKLDATRAAVGDSAKASDGRVASESTNAQDVTERYTDVVTRQAVDEAALAQMKKLLTAAESVPDVLAVKREMDAITQRLEGAKAARGSMESRAAMSSLSVSVNMPQPPHQPPPPPPAASWSAGATLAHALGSLKAFLRGCADVGIYTAVFAVPTGLALAALALVARRFLVPSLERWASAGAGAGTGAGGAAGAPAGYTPLR